MRRPMVLQVTPPDYPITRAKARTWRQRIRKVIAIISSTGATVKRHPIGAGLLEVYATPGQLQEVKRLLYRYKVEWRDR